MYRSYKNFTESLFLEDIQNTGFNCDSEDMNTNLGKVVYTRSHLKNNFNKNSTNENKVRYKKQRNFCVNLRKKSYKRTL